MADVGGCDAGLLLEDLRELRVDGAKGVDDDLSLHGLDRIHDNSHRTLVQLLETLCVRYNMVSDPYLLRVHIDAGQPTSKARVAVVPAHDGLRAARLLEQLEHVGLEYRIHGLDRDTSTGLRHRKDVDHTHLPNEKIESNEKGGHTV
jgi:hypothetical protein